MYLNQSLMTGEVADAQHVDRLHEASAARRSRMMRAGHRSRHLRHVLDSIRGWTGLSAGAHRQEGPIGEVETTIARCMREAPPAQESLADLDEALVQQLLTGYFRPAPDSPSGTSCQAEWIPDLQSNPYLRDAA
jgi:hypothetical protein